MAIALQSLSRGFSRLGHGNLRGQLHRAASSIPCNIVEGCGATSNKEFARYLDIAIKSANETEYHLLCARDHHLLSPDAWRKYTSETVELRKMIYAYRRKVLDSDRDAN